ncbi:probable serine hydrolase [Drosophila grimshawi]|uniref:GH16489 n=1 Tax=Drosophila grimshawi TaxID=7222 RepID=B4J0J8_DROGR|nr:probable serine hydrolase [Drosophila grimshawi]EDV96834.1 GH16489 [Drosophila grimshawi]EDW04582.1 GH23210 [Drosophila grimshawi]
MGTLSLSDFEDVRIWAPWGYLYGRWYGSRSVRPILAIHGWLDNLGSFDTLIPFIPDYLSVLCVDLAGHGGSDRLPAGMHYSADDWIIAIARIMKQYKWPKVSLMGQSLGGSLSFLYASIAPHLVDMIIALDIVLPPLESSDTLSTMAYFMEKHLQEEARSAINIMNVPRTYTEDQLRFGLSKASNFSVPLELSHHLLYRSVAKSQLYPNKFYLTRDNRVKFYTLFPFNPVLAAEMARRIKRMPYLIIKGSESNFINSGADEVISILKNQNPYFEYHVVPGTHHVHLMNAEGCAQHIVPFLKRHRPPGANKDVQVSNKL